MNELELLERAIEIAVQAHKGQKDRYGAPYLLHPLRVMARLDTPQERIVAILHDVVEDSDWTFERLKQAGIPDVSLEAVRCLTKQPAEPYEMLVQRAAGNPIAREVKIADLEDNMDLRRMTQVTDADLGRLNKYLRAWRKLKGGEAEDKKAGTYVPASAPTDRE